MDALVRAFPDIPIIPVVGNNDVPFHDQAPTDEQRSWYYTDLWQLWFEDVPANAALVANETIKADFMYGGWYVYEITPDIMIICLNGMQPFYENYAAVEKADEMIEFVNKTLTDNPNKKFIT